MITGSCFCSKVSYTLDGSLQSGRSCHCSRCRKAFSGASSAYAQLSADSTLSWSGREFLSTSADEGLAIGFCGSCGSTLCGMWNGEVHGLTLGCVDGDPGVDIEEHIFVGSKAPWDHIGGDAPQFEEHSITTSQ
jgi:hypothetical protein